MNVNVAEMNQRINASIYIPRVSVAFSETDIRNQLLSNGIGYVISMDFTPINKKPGFREYIIGQDLYMSVFIHLDIRPDSCQNLNQEFWATILSDKPYKMMVSPTHYWICLRNKQFIPRTCMNIHQVVENGRYLENMLDEQTKTIQEQNDRIQELEKKLDNVTYTVYQLLGGLFNQTTQHDNLQLHINKLLHGKNAEHDICDQSKWTIWPTTRQGDYCEQRLDKLDAFLQVNTTLSVENPEYMNQVKTNYKLLSQDKHTIKQTLDMTNDSLEASMAEEELTMVKAEKEAIKQNFKQATGQSLSKYLCGVDDSSDDQSSISLDSYERINASWELCGNH